MTPDEVFAAWAADVHARGGVVTVWPSGPHRGYKAERYPKAGGGYRYADPPEPVMQLEDALRAQERSDIDAGARLQMLQDALANAGRWVLALPRNIVTGVIGWPSWVVPVGALALAVFLVREWGRRPGLR